MMAATGLDMYRYDLLSETIVFFLLLAASWSILWFIAYFIYRWIAAGRTDKVWFGEGTTMAAGVISLLGTVLVAYWVLRGGRLPASWQWSGSVLVSNYQGGPYVAYALVTLSLGLLPVLAVGLVGILSMVMLEPTRPMRRVVGQCLILLIAGVCCLWVMGVVDGLAVAGMVALSFVAMLAISLYSASTARPIEAAASADISPERQRVLRLLEEGKINGHESAELLVALAQTVSSEPVAAPLSRPRKVMIAGVLLALVGFFLPWFVVNPQTEAARLMGWGPGHQPSPQRMYMNGQEAMTGFPAMAGGADVVVRGGDVGSGLGWLALALPFAVVVLPHVYPKLPAGNLRTVTLLALSAGSVITLYLVISGWRFAAYGIGVFACGYAVLWAGAVADRRGRLA